MTPEMTVVPHGGVWSYIQKLPAGGIRQFVGLTEDDLCKQVRQFRLNNNLPIGDVAVEIKRKNTGAPPEQRSLRERVTGWKSNRVYQKLEFVDPEVAEARAKVCVDCPYNKVDYSDDCRECYSHVERDLYAMRQGKETDQDQWLGACEICGHENKTAVHLDPENLMHRTNYLEQLKEKKPDCWLLHLDKEPTKELE